MALRSNFAKLHAKGLRNFLSVGQNGPNLNVIETEVIGNKQIKYMKDSLEKFVIIAKDTENVDASKYRAFKLKQRLMKSYPQLVFCVPKMRNVSEIVYVENLDSSELVEEHMSIKSENNDEDFDEESCTQPRKPGSLYLREGYSKDPG